MLLPHPLFQALSPHFGHHGCWHIARHPDQDELRAQFAGECGDQLYPLNDPRSGCDFLRFHRRMMRHFYGVLIQRPVRHFRFRPWTGERLPEWVEPAVLDVKPDFDFDAAYRGIAERIARGTIEELGGFIERNELFEGVAGAGLHNAVHLGLGRLEERMNPSDNTASMTDMAHAPGNVFFWTLHAWIDERFAAWQRLHGEEVDLSPLEMDHVHVTCSGEASFPV